MNINIQSDKLYSCKIPFPIAEEYQFLWNFLKKYYPCTVSSEEVNLGEWEPTLICKGFGTKLLTYGDEIAHSKIGDIYIGKEKGIEFKPENLKDWVGNAVAEYEAQIMYYGKSIREDEYYGVKPKFRLFADGFNDPDSWYSKPHKR